MPLIVSIYELNRIFTIWIDKAKESNP